MDRKYKVIVNGTVLDGFDRSKVCSNLAAAFKLDLNKADRLIDGTPRTIRKDLGRATAEKYSKILLKAGASCSIELQENEIVSEPVKPGLNEVKKIDVKETHAVIQEDEQSGPECPRCGYEAKSPDDTILTRGDCPKCGFIADKELFDKFKAEEDFQRSESDSEDDFFRDWIPAGRERKLLASIYTFTLFVWMYLGLLFFCIFAFVPVVQIPLHVFKKFYQTALVFFPEFLAGMAIVTISFIMPLYYEGRTWGQKKAGIELLYVTEAQSGGLYLSLLFRTLTILALSYVPGFAVLKLINWISPLDNQSISLLIIALSAAASWFLSRLFTSFRKDEKSLTDLAAGIVQTEADLVPIGAVGKAAVKLSHPVGIIVLLTLVIPGLLRLFRI